MTFLIKTLAVLSVWMSVRSRRSPVLDAGGQHVEWADKICSHSGQGSLADELHVVHEYSHLQPFRQQYAS